MSEDTGREIGWDDPIENDGEDFTPLPEGDYPFKVTEFERSRFEGSAKMPACNRANLKLEVDGGDLGKRLVFNNLLLHSKTEWAVAAFAVSIGVREKGGKAPIPWNRIVGMSGRCHVTIREYEKDGETRRTNNISKFLAPDTTPSQPAQQAASAKNLTQDLPF